MELLKAFVVIFTIASVSNCTKPQSSDKKTKPAAAPVGSPSAFGPETNAAGSPTNGGQTVGQTTNGTDKTAQYRSHLSNKHLRETSFNGNIMCVKFTAVPGACTIQYSNSPLIFGTCDVVKADDSIVEISCKIPDGKGCKGYNETLASILPKPGQVKGNDSRLDDRVFKEVFWEVGASLCNF